MYPGSYLKLREVTVVLHDCLQRFSQNRLYSMLGTHWEHAPFPDTPVSHICLILLMNIQLYLHCISILVAQYAITFTSHPHFGEISVRKAPDTHRQSNSRQVLMLSQSNWKAQGAAAAAMDVWCHRPMLSSSVISSQKSHEFWLVKF